MKRPKPPVWSGAATSAVIGLITGVTTVTLIEHWHLPPLPAAGLWMLTLAAAWALLGTLNKLRMLK
jgi:hypothetical protein